MAGSFGLEAEHYQASQAMAGLSLLPALAAAPADAMVIANGFSCRHQIAHGGGRRARHIVLILREALARHQAKFEMNTGLCTDGPCKGAHLKRIPAKVLDGEVCVSGITLLDEDDEAPRPPARA